jgi:hypothetical protein
VATAAHQLNFWLPPADETASTSAASKKTEERALGIYQRPQRRIEVSSAIQLSPVVMLALWVATVWLRSI